MSYGSQVDARRRLPCFSGGLESPLNFSSCLHTANLFSQFALRACGQYMCCPVTAISLGPLC